MSSLFVEYVEWCEFAGRRVVRVHWSYSGVSSLVVEWCEFAGRRGVRVRWS